MIISLKKSLLLSGVSLIGTNALELQTATAKVAINKKEQLGHQLAAVVAEGTPITETPPLKGDGTAEGTPATKTPTVEGDGAATKPEAEPTSTPKASNKPMRPKETTTYEKMGKVNRSSVWAIFGMAALAIVYGVVMWAVYLKSIKIEEPVRTTRGEKLGTTNDENTALLGSSASSTQPKQAYGKGPEDIQNDAPAAITDEPIIVENPEKVLATMKQVAEAISVGANAFMTQEIIVMSVCIAMGAVILGLVLWSWQIAIAFIIGSVTSTIAGYLGMKVAVYSNVRTTVKSWSSLSEGFEVALWGGSIMGFLLCGLGIMSFLGTWVMLYFSLPHYHGQYGGISYGDDHGGGGPLTVAHCMCGFGLGASLVALFARVGGGIYTKAADVGADLSGKNEYGMDEDDPRNPACIADNVGDNVGDIAGMGADLFGSLAESSAAALYIWWTFASETDEDTAAGRVVHEVNHSLYPLAISASGIITGLLSLLLHFVLPSVKCEADVEGNLKRLLFTSTVIQTGAAFAVGAVCLPDRFLLRIDANSHGEPVSNLHISSCVIIGLWAGFFIGLITEYYTSHRFSPVRNVADAYRQSASTGLILGHALGMVSCAVPVILIAVSVAGCMVLAGPFGIAMAALGMLSTLCISLTLDAYGPIADNAGGIAEMSGLPGQVRERTDCLDAAGNTTAAIGKGFAIGSAALVGFALFMAFVLAAHEGLDFEPTNSRANEVIKLNLLRPLTLCGLLVGVMLPFIFAALLMTSVARAAQDMLDECLRQFPLIINEGKEPDYDRCIKISTFAALREMILPALMVIASPILGGLIFGTAFVSGMLLGIITSGIMLAISMSNSGGAYDNAKKYIEAGGLGADHKKGSMAHKNAVIGDTLGDPLKDTSGPALNIFVKLAAVTALTFAPMLRQYSTPYGDPLWGGSSGVR